jgi:hypothetical protein
MRTISCALVIAATWGASASAVEKVPTSQRCLQAIAAFAADPAGPRALDEGKIIIAFAQGNDAVTVNLDEKLAPFITDPLAAEVKARLLAAYVAGNVKAQLEKGKPGDQPYPASLFLIKTYGQLKAADPRLSSPATEKLAALEKKGQLKKYLEELARQAPATK